MSSICSNEFSHSDISILECRIAKQTVSTIDEDLEPELLYFISKLLLPYPFFFELTQLHWESSFSLFAYPIPLLYYISWYSCIFSVDATGAVYCIKRYVMQYCN